MCYQRFCSKLKGIFLCGIFIWGILPIINYDFCIHPTFVSVSVIEERAGLCYPALLSVWLLYELYPYSQEGRELLFIRKKIKLLQILQTTIIFIVMTIPPIFFLYRLVLPSAFLFFLKFALVSLLYSAIIYMVFYLLFSYTITVLMVIFCLMLAYLCNDYYNIMDYLVRINCYEKEYCFMLFRYGLLSIVGYGIGYYLNKYKLLLE